jgi:exosortase
LHTHHSSDSPRLSLLFRTGWNLNCAVVNFRVVWLGHRRMSHFAEVRTLPQRILVSPWREQIWKVTVLCFLVAWLYRPIVVGLAEQCWRDPNCSHGFLVPIFSGFVLWRERSRLLTLSPRPSAWGLPFLVAALGVLVVGVFGAELFLSRVSFLLVVASLIVHLLGWGYFRAVLFPLAFLILMIPLPEIVLGQVTFPLQILASKFAAASLHLMNVPVLREGNVIKLSTITLAVAEACSGIRSLSSLLTLAVIYGFFVEQKKSIRTVLVFSAIPIAVVANGLRIFGTGLLAQYWGPSIAEGFFHTFSGLSMFLLCLVLLGCLHRVFVVF